MEVSWSWRRVQGTSRRKRDQPSQHNRPPPVTSWTLNSQKTDTGRKKWETLQSRDLARYWDSSFSFLCKSFLQASRTLWSKTLHVTLHSLGNQFHLIFSQVEEIERKRLLLFHKRESCVDSTFVALHLFIQLLTLVSTFQIYSWKINICLSYATCLHETRTV